MYQYKRINHLAEKLNQFKNLENHTIPDDVLNKVKQYLEQNNLMPNILNIKKALKYSALQNYYEHIYEITNLLNSTQINKAAEKMTKDKEIILKENYECPVCMEEFVIGTNLRELNNCTHIFCTTCINLIKKNDRITCPLCRSQSLEKALGFGNGMIKPLTDDQYSKLMSDFKKFSKEFDVYTKENMPHRINFLNYNFVLSKLLILNGFANESEVNSNIVQLKSIEKSQIHDQIWNHIAKDLGWIKNM